MIDSKTLDKVFEVVSYVAMAALSLAIGSSALAVAVVVWKWALS